MIQEPCELKSGLVKQFCRCGCEGCYYENEEICPYDKCSTPEEEFIFISSNVNSIIKSVEVKKVETKTQVKKVKPLF